VRENESRNGGILPVDVPRTFRTSFELDRKRGESLMVFATFEIGDKINSAVADRLRNLDPRSENLFNEELSA